MKHYEYFIEGDYKEHCIDVDYGVDYEYNKYDNETIAHINIYELYIKNYVSYKHFFSKQERDEYVQKYMNENFSGKWGNFQTNYEERNWMENNSQKSVFKLIDEKYSWKDKFVIETQDKNEHYDVMITHLRKLDENSEIVDDILNKMYEDFDLF